MGFDLEAEERPGNGHDKEQEIGTDLPVLMKLSRERPICWVLMPQVLERIKESCRKYDIDSDPEKLAHAIQINFASGNEDVLVLIAVLPSRYKVVGHLLADMGEWTGKKFTTIIQYERDEGVEIERELLKAGLAVVEKWGRERGAKEIQAFVRDAELALAFQRVYGFKRVPRIQMRKSL